MMIKIQQFTFLFIFFTGFAVVFGNCTAVELLPFEVAEVRFEQNSTDGDIEVVFEVKAGDKGLSELKVTAPDGKEVVNITSSDKSKMGIRQFRFESPEPKDIKAMMTAYPEGEYVFTGTTTDGKNYQSKAWLNHTLPSTVSFVNPKPEAEDVSIENLSLSWSPAKDAASYFIEIDQEELNFNMTLKLGGDKTSFMLPESVIIPGKEYTIGIGAVSKNGNMSVVETSFTTAK